MKKIIMLIAVMCFFTLSVIEAQINKGRMIIGVSSRFSLINQGSDLLSLGFSSTKYKSNAPGYVEPAPDKTTSLNFLPKIGYFVIDNLAVGLDVWFASSSEKSGEYGSKNSLTLFGLGPFVRYYIPAGKAMPFLEVGSLFGTVNNKYASESSSSTYTSRAMSIGGGVGIAVPLGDKVAFDMMAGYNSVSDKAKENNPNDERTVQGTIGIKLGFVVLLGSN